MPRTSPVYVSARDRERHRRVLARRAVLVRELALHQLEAGNLGAAAESEERAALLDHVVTWLMERRDAGGLATAGCAS